MYFVRFCGGYAGVVPPDPIPNSEVKYPKADDTPLWGKVGSRHKSAQIFLRQDFLSF